MHYTIVATKQFKKSLKKIKHDKPLLNKLEVIIDLLSEDKDIPQVYKDHQLMGNLKGFRELHIKPNYLLVYKKEAKELILLLSHMGSHSDIF